ncbi:Myosin XVIIIA, variant 2 [Chamberlinius hualienensis]
MDLKSPRLVAQALRAMLGQSEIDSGIQKLDHNQAKSENQLASEKAWLDDQRVWLVHHNGYTGAVLVSENVKEADKAGEIELGKAKIKLDENGQVVDVEEEDVEKANPSQFDQVEDLSQLRYLNESSVLHALRQRYASSLIHTYAGNSSMIIVNPMRPLSIYTEKVIQMFRGCKRDDMPPHVYAVAQSAYRNMVTSRIDQSIVLMGRSGSGKTVNFQHILTYLSHTVGSVNKILTVEKLKAIFILLEYFGHCHTKLNSNATRYTLIFSLDFDHSGQIANASLQAFMLDRSRLIRGRVNEVEDNYKIFKHMLNGMDDKQKRELFLETLAASNLFVGKNKEDVQQANFHWARAQSSFELLGVKDEDSKAIWSVLAAIHHLGAAGVENGPNGKGQFKNPQSAQKAASLLGTTIEQLARTIFQSGSGLNGGVNGSLGPPSRNTFRTSPTDKGQPEAAVDAIEALQGTVVGLYCEIFNAIISLINKSISSNSRTANSILVLDTPGFQNSATCDSGNAASFEDLCNNYIQERLQLLFHDHVIVAQHDKYTQEKIEYSQNDLEESSPLSVVNLIDKPSQQGLMRSSNLDLRNADHKGLLWLLDEEAIFPGSNDDTFLERLFMHNSSGGNGNNHIFKTSRPHHFALSHLLGTNVVVYNAQGWLKSCRENVNVRSAIMLLQESQKNNISRLFVTSRGPVSMTISGSVVGIEGTMSLRRASSIRRAFTTGTASIKRKSLCLQVKFQVDGIIETLRRTRLHFVHCILPQHDAGLCGDAKLSQHKNVQSPSTPEEFHLNIPLLRSQIRGTQILDAVRLNKQGFPDHMLYSEFRRRFELLGPPEAREASPVLDEKKAIETLMGSLDIDKTQYKLGLSQVFFRTGALVQLEEQRDERLQDTVVRFQSYCRGYLARKKFAKRKVQELAIRCIQRNVRKFMVVRSWPWWRLLVRVVPLLNVHRTEEELKSKTEELETLRLKVEKIERERNELKHENNKLEAKVSELTADLAEEHATSTNASEMLEAEMSERMRMEKELQETNTLFSDLQRVHERVEMEVMELRMMKATDMNGDLSGDEDGENSVYKQRYDSTRRELELIKKKMKQQIEDDQEQMMLTRKTVERKVAEAVEEADIQRQAVSQWKRKVQRLNQEMNDMKYMLEEQTARNAALEKKQRKFDVELSAALEQVRQEKLGKEKFQKERDQIMGERYTIEQELESVKLEMEMKNDKLAALTKELDDLTFGSKGDEEIAQLKRAKHEMELKLKEQEEELDDLAGQVSMLEQAKLRLEMNFENVRKEHRKELSQKDEEMEETRASCQKKLKLLEHQLETEHEDRQALIREKHELERKLYELQERPMVNQDAETVARLRKDLKRTKALLKDAQLMLERNKGDSATKAAIRQLKNQLEDAEFARTAAIKSKQGIELELQEAQSQLDDTAKVKAELDKKASVLAREKTDLQAQLEENEEELAEVMRKYKASVTQLSVDQTQLAELAGQVSDLEVERNMLRDQLTELTGKLEQLEGETVSSHEQKRLEMKVKEMETRLELEATTRGRLEVQLNRVRETLEKVIQECDSFRAKEQQAQEANRKLQRQLRDAKEDYAVLQQKELELNQRRHEMELSLETSEVELQTARSDLKLALKRIEDLQAAMEDNGGESDDSEVDSDGDSSDTSVESFLLNHRVSQPTSRSRLTSSGNSSFYSSSTFGRTNSLGEVDVVSPTTMKTILGKNSLWLG